MLNQNQLATSLPEETTTSTPTSTMIQIPPYADWPEIQRGTCQQQYYTPRGYIRYFVTDTIPPEDIPWFEASRKEEAANRPQEIYTYDVEDDYIDSDDEEENKQNEDVDQKIDEEDDYKDPEGYVPGDGHVDLESVHNPVPVFVLGPGKCVDTKSMIPDCSTKKTAPTGPLSFQERIILASVTKRTPSITITVDDTPSESDDTASISDMSSESDQHSTTSSEFGDSDTASLSGSSSSDDETFSLPGSPKSFPTKTPEVEQPFALEHVELVPFRFEPEPELEIQGAPYPAPLFPFSWDGSNLGELSPYIVSHEKIAKRVIYTLVDGTKVAANKFVNMTPLISDEIKPLFGITKISRHACFIRGKKTVISKVTANEQKFTKKLANPRNIQSIQRAYIFRWALGLTGNYDSTLQLRTYKSGVSDVCSYKENKIHYENQNHWGSVITKTALKKWFDNCWFKLYDVATQMFLGVTEWDLRQNIEKIVRRLDREYISWPARIANRVFEKVGASMHRPSYIPSMIRHLPQEVLKYTQSADGAWHLNPEFKEELPPPDLGLDISQGGRVATYSRNGLYPRLEFDVSRGGTLRAELEAKFAADAAAAAVAPPTTTPVTTTPLPLPEEPITRNKVPQPPHTMTNLPILPPAIAKRPTLPVLKDEGITQLKANITKSAALQYTISDPSALYDPDEEDSTPISTLEPKIENLNPKVNTSPRYPNPTMLQNPDDEDVPITTSPETKIVNLNPKVNASPRFPNPTMLENPDDDEDAPLIASLENKAATNPKVNASPHLPLSMPLQTTLENKAITTAKVNAPPHLPRSTMLQNPDDDEEPVPQPKVVRKPLQPPYVMTNLPILPPGLTFARPSTDAVQPKIRVPEGLKLRMPDPNVCYDWEGDDDEVDDEINE